MIKNVFNVQLYLGIYCIPTIQFWLLKIVVKMPCMKPLTLEKLHLLYLLNTKSLKNPQNHCDRYYVGVNYDMNQTANCRFFPKLGTCSFHNNFAYSIYIYACTMRSNCLALCKLWLNSSLFRWCYLPFNC